MTTTRRRRTVATVAACALAGAVIGAGGASLALWSDSAEVTGALATGHEHFAVGAPGAPAPAPSGVSVLTVGRETAEALVRDGEVAVPIQVDSVSQGNKGLRYELSLPESWGDNVLGAADVRVFRVAGVDRCAVEVLSPQDAPAGGELFSVPVPATYSTGAEPVTEYWCVYATYAGPPVVGDYENTATVTATSPAGERVDDQDRWHAAVVADLDPAAEPEHELTFTYRTFRPGEDQ